MNTQEKSLKLAELVPDVYPLYGVNWEPYADSDYGRAQFAAILLDNLEVMFAIVNKYGTMYIPVHTGDEPIVCWESGEPPTQAIILDEILRMKGGGRMTREELTIDTDRCPKYACTMKFMEAMEGKWVAAPCKTFIPEDILRILTEGLDEAYRAGFKDCNAQHQEFCFVIGEKGSE